jgi:hypothetical protein
MPDPADVERVRRESMEILQRDLPPRRTIEHDPLERWSRPADPEPAKREPEPPPAAVETDWSGWERWADAKIRNAVAAEREFMLEVVGKALGQALDDLAESHRRDLDGSVAQLKLELAKLTTVLGEVRIASGSESGRAVLDLPPFPRSRNVN